jgi:hypothetical protein
MEHRVQPGAFEVLLMTDGCINFCECIAKWIVEKFSGELDSFSQRKCRERFRWFAPGDLEIGRRRIFHDEGVPVQILVERDGLDSFLSMREAVVPNEELS